MLAAAAAGLASLPVADPFGSSSQAACVAEGTRISTPEGDVAVESLDAGDTVVAVDAQKVERARRVVANPSRESTQWLEVRLGDGSHLKLTRDHLVATRHGWRRAGDLREGDDLVTRSGRSPVELIHSRSGRIRVYDPDVAGDNTYFANGVLVHNKDSAPLADVQAVVLGP